jgi:putative ABC transport system permease protein
VGCELWDFGYKVDYNGQSTNSNVSICGGTPEYPDNNTHYIGLGRNLSPLDIKTGGACGDRIPDREEAVPVHGPNRENRARRRPQVRVIGVFDEKKSAFGSGYDNYVLIPISTFQGIYGMMTRDGFRRSVNITVHAKTPALVTRPSIRPRR